ncbi:MAG: head GIN domain-containing protein [Bacteroidota bacterium]
MKSFLLPLKSIIAVLAVMTILFTSCTDEYLPGIKGEGDIVEASLYPDDFTGFVCAIAADVYLTQGDTQEVVVEAQENIIDNIMLHVSNGIWLIEYHNLVLRAEPVKIFITVPDLTKAAISGTGSIIGLTAFENLGHLDLSISGSGDMDIETESEELEVRISCAGDMDLRGKTEYLDISISGSGSIDAFDLPTREVEISISGSGNAYVDVEDYLDVTISGSGSVFYQGNPEVDLHITGSGTVRRNR